MTLANASAWAPSGSGRPATSGFLAKLTVVDIFKDSTAWIVLPDEPDDPVSPISGLLGETRALTGWALRDLAGVLGTSHTTIGRLEANGRVTGRSRAVATRAAELHAVIVRLARVAGGPEALAVALGQTVRGATPLALLREGQWSTAYTAALDVLRGPRPAMRGASKFPVGAATREIRS